MKLDIELIQTEWIATKLIEPNMGQIPGVKSNPRRMRADEYKKLVKSIEEDPEMLALNPCWVFPFDGRFVVLNGNQRCEVLARKKVEKAPCKVIPADTPVEKLNRYIVKINTHYGEWDWDMLANEWEATDLADWGVDFPQDWAKPEQPEPADSSEPDEPEAEERESIDAPPDLLYPSNNIMDVPVLLPNMQAGGVVLPVAPWGANSRMRNDVATYHCYVDDYRFTRLWREPQLLANSRCGAVVEPNFSLHDQTPIAWGLQAIYKKRWLARWCQE